MEYGLFENMMAMRLNKEFNAAHNPKFLHFVHGKGPLNSIQSSDLISSQYALAPLQRKL